MAGHHTTSSGLESTRSLLSSLPSDWSDGQTEITPPTSPAPFEGKARTPRDILNASRRLGQISALALQSESDLTPSKPPNLKLSHLRGPSQCTSQNDEAGYDADADGDGDGDEDEGARAGTSATPATRLTRRPAFLRIDTRQHRRVASMLATRRPTSPIPNFGDANAPPRRSRLSSIRFKPTAGPTANAESYELRRRSRAEPIGLGIGFPENHPLRSRAFSMPVPHSASPISDDVTAVEEEAVQEEEQARQFEWLPPGFSTRLRKKPALADVQAPNPVRLTLRPTFLEVSPSPIECLPAPAGVAGTSRCDNIHDRSEMERERRASAGVTARFTRSVLTIGSRSALHDGGDGVP